MRKKKLNGNITRRKRRVSSTVNINPPLLILRRINTHLSNSPTITLRQFILKDKVQQTTVLILNNQALQTTVFILKDQALQTTECPTKVNGLALQSESNASNANMLVLLMSFNRQAALVAAVAAVVAVVARLSCASSVYPALPFAGLVWVLKNLRR